MNDFTPIFNEAVAQNPSAEFLQSEVRRAKDESRYAAMLAGAGVPMSRTGQQIDTRRVAVMLTMIHTGYPRVAYSWFDPQAQDV